MNKIDGAMLRSMLISGANKLTNDRPLIDKLNVFPVPDGDTGTNMSLTITSAINELQNTKSNDLTSIGKAISKGSLMGARGNSGVILSQILRGFAKGIEGKDYLDPKLFAKALKEAQTVAYTAVMKPVEGTILTVIRETATETKLIVKHNPEMPMGEFLDKLVEIAKESLDKTPELLKALKDAGVVDSGGKGLLSLFEGMKLGFEGKTVEIREADEVDYDEFMAHDNHQFEGEIQFGYCTEFMILDSTISPNDLRDQIESYGDSMVVVGDDGIVKIHIHTNDPGTVMAIAGLHGMLDKIKIENMRLQQKELLGQTCTERKKYGLISVVAGDGMERIMKDLAVDHVIEGGQTMNPSTSDFVKVIDKINADNIIIFPNNTNIIMAAKQAKDLVTDKNIVVIETKTIPQAISALITFNPDADLEDNIEEMTEAKDMVKTGQITYAVRDTNSNGVNIKKDDIIAISGSNIICSEKTIEDATLKLLKNMVDQNNDDIITLYYGEKVTEEEAGALAKKIECEYKNQDIEIHRGNQPVYYYIISVE